MKGAGMLQLASDQPAASIGPKLWLKLPPAHSSGGLSRLLGSGTIELYLGQGREQQQRLQLGRCKGRKRAAAAASHARLGSATGPDASWCLLLTGPSGCR
jgi:hypothetical protein